MHLGSVTPRCVHSARAHVPSQRQAHVPGQHRSDYAMPDTLSVLNHRKKWLLVAADRHVCYNLLQRRFVLCSPRRLVLGDQVQNRFGLQIEILAGASRIRQSNPNPSPNPKPNLTIRQPYESVADTVILPLAKTAITKERIFTKTNDVPVAFCHHHRSIFVQNAPTYVAFRCVANGLDR